MIPQIKVATLAISFLAVTAINAVNHVSNWIHELDRKPMAKAEQVKITKEESVNMSEGILRIWVGNLKKYNEGELVGKWIGLPNSEVWDIINEEVLKGDEEYMINDYECDIDGVKVGEYDNIDKLNELAEELEDIDDEDLFAVVLEYEDGDVERALEKYKERDFSYYVDINSERDLGEAVADEMGLLDDVPDTISRYFDYESFGHDLAIGDYWICESKGIAISRY